MITVQEIEKLNANELLQELYGKPLQTKKEVLEYVELTKVLKQEGIPQELIQDTYNLISDSIDEMKSKVKPNTIMFLKNQLRGQLGKFVNTKEKKVDEEGFIKFFKAAYPEGKRNRDYTYVIQDIEKISIEQIWTTLAYINRLCIKENILLTNAEKNETKIMIEKILKKGNIKYINQVKSMEKLLKKLNVNIVKDKDIFKIK